VKLLALAFGILAFHGAASGRAAQRSAARGGAAPARIQVVAKEFSFGLSRVDVKAGQAVIELANFGQDAHDLRLQHVGSRHIAGLGIVVPGERGELTVKLTRGRYSFWCSVANHRKLGMRATLVVR
jgi:plastocyanin